MMAWQVMFVIGQLVERRGPPAFFHLGSPRCVLRFSASSRFGTSSFPSAKARSLPLPLSLWLSHVIVGVVTFQSFGIPKVPKDDGS